MLVVEIFNTNYLLLFILFFNTSNYNLSYLGDQLFAKRPLLSNLNY